MATAPDYIDQIDNGVASVVAPNGDTRTVALADLPTGVKEGHYVSGGQIVPAPAEDTEGPQIRARLAGGDTGGPISLDDGSPAGDTVMSPVGQIPANTPGLPEPTGAVDIADTGEAAPAAPGPADAFIDKTIGAPAIGAPEQEKEIPIPPLGKGGLPASSEDLQERILQGTEREKKALEGEGEAKEAGREKVQEAQEARDELRRQQAAALAAEQLSVRDRQKALDDEDAANLQKARDTVIPDFWQSREGMLAGAAITAGLSGAAAALMGSTHNAALEAINHNVDSYYTRERQKIDSLYKYAEAKGALNDKTRARYAGELTDLMQQHAYTLQAAADRIQEVSDQAKGLVDQAQTKTMIAQLQGKAVGELAKAREIDEKRYDAQTKREIAEADMIKANAAMAKVHKGKGGGAGAGGTDWMTAMQEAAQQPGATQASVMAAATAAGYHGKVNQLGTMANAEINSAGKTVKDVETQMGDFRKELEGSGTKQGPGRQVSNIQAMKKTLADAAASGDPKQLLAAVTQMKEEAGGMLSGGKTTKFTGQLIDELGSVKDELIKHGSRFTDPTVGKHFVATLTSLLSGVEQEKLAEVNDIREKAIKQTLAPGGSANSPAAKRAAMNHFKGMFGEIKDANGNPVYQEGGAKPAAGAAGGGSIPAGAKAGKLPDGSKGYALGGQMFRMDGTPYVGK